MDVRKKWKKQIPKYLFPSGFSEAYCNHILPHLPFVQIELMIHGFFYTAFPITFPHYFFNHCSPTKFSSTDSTKEILFLLSFPGKIPVHHYCYILTYFVEDGCFYEDVCNKSLTYLMWEAFIGICCLFPKSFCNCFFTIVLNSCFLLIRCLRF